jgi:hypothetical protein
MPKRAAKKLDIDRVQECIKQARHALGLLNGYREDCGDDFGRHVDMVDEALLTASLHLTGEAEPTDDESFDRSVAAYEKLNEEGA